MNRMLKDILAQPKSLERVLAYHTGEGAEMLAQVGATLRTAFNIVITGMGASLYSGMVLQHHLAARGVPSAIAETGELLHFWSDWAHGSAVVLLSRSGETVEVLKLLPVLKEKEAFIIGVTNVRESTLAREAHLVLDVSSDPDEAVAIQTYTGTTLLMLLLADAILEREHPGEAEAAIARVAASIEEHNQPDRWKAMLAGAHSVYGLGRGQSLAAAYEAGLLFNEAAKLPSVAMPAANFRHGHIEVADASFRGFLFSSEPATRALDESLAAHLSRVGAGVLSVNESGYFAPVTEIVPAQLAAYYAAEQRGFTPGRFRYVSVVTASETDLSS